MLAAACAPAPGTDEPSAGAADSIGALPAAASHDWTIVPGERIGPVTLETAEARLIESLGNERVVRREVYLAEGYCTDGSVLYPDSADAVEIGWADSTRARPAFLRIRGERSRWATPAGVRIGTTLKELEAIRGEPLTFSGFGWDYGGGLHWPEPGDAHAAGLRISPDVASSEAARADPAWEEILGDRPVRSDHPLVRRLNIIVEEIAIGGGATLDEHECRTSGGA